MTVARGYDCEVLMCVAGVSSFHDLMMSGALSI